MCKLVMLFARPICKLLRNSTCAILVGKCVMTPVVELLLPRLEYSVYPKELPLRAFLLIKKIKSLKRKKQISMEIINPYTAGIDIGIRTHFVAIGQGEKDVREF